MEATIVFFLISIILNKCDFHFIHLYLTSQCVHLIILNIEYVQSH